MKNDNKYQLYISFQQTIITELRNEFAVNVNTDRQFPPCVTYKNGKYNYNLDVIRIVFAHYFKENFIALTNAKSNSTGSFATEVFKRMPHAINNINNIKNERRFRKEFQVKALEIKTKYFNTR